MEVVMRKWKIWRMAVAIGVIVLGVHARSSR